MARAKYANIFLALALVTFSLFSKIVFDKVYVTSNVVVDEEFHVPLGEAYCKYEFKQWHPKVTTFPGLYLLSSLLLGPFNLCSTYWLRLVSLLFSFVNVILFYCLLNANNDGPLWKNAVSALNLGLLPPLYFFSHLYYTDVASLTMILCLFVLSQRGNHYLASIFGMFSVLFRQTNVIWVGMVFANYVLQELNMFMLKKHAKEGVSVQELLQLSNIFKSGLWLSVRRATLHFWLSATCYGSLLIAFLVFVYLNGSIVVGDKTAHEATIHIPQIFYFSLFCLFFGWPYFVMEVTRFIRYTTSHKAFIFCAALICLVIIYSNTLVHPYLLADNRHYVFYIWNRFYGRHILFRYLLVPVYLFSLFVIASKLWNRRDVTFVILFVPCTLVVLVTQRLLEFRYFFIPYVLFRTRLKNVKSQSLLYEFLTYFVINICTFYLFFTKTIEWEDFDYAQRLIW